MISLRSLLGPTLLATMLLSLSPSPAVAEKRNIGGRADFYLRETLIGRFSRDRELVAERLRVNLANGGVFLSGTASNWSLKLRAFTTAASTFGVINVTDLMVVRSHDLSDDSLRGAVLDALEARAESLQIEDLVVKVEDSVATLEGTTPNVYSLIKAEEAAGTVFGITKIDNRLRPRDAPSGTDDQSIAEAVLAYLGDARRFGYPAEIEIDVEDGVVTLSGTGRLYSALHQAAMVARMVGGVKRVESQVLVDPSLPVQLPLVTLASR